MASYTLTDLSNKSGEIVEAAFRGPVDITKHGKRKFVLLTADQFDRLVENTRSGPTASKTLRVRSVRTSWPDSMRSPGTMPERPAIQHGDVIRYSYLWAREFDQGEHSGRKARPTCVMIVVPSRDGPSKTLLFPITSQPPTSRRRRRWRCGKPRRAVPGSIVRLGSSSTNSMSTISQPPGGRGCPAARSVLVQVHRADRRRRCLGDPRKRRPQRSETLNSPARAAARRLLGAHAHTLLRWRDVLPTILPRRRHQ